MNLLTKLWPPAKRMRIVKHGNPCLRRTSEPVIEVTPRIRELAERMVASMLAEEIAGVGLAAPQVGVNLRLIAVATHDPTEPPSPDASPGELLLNARMPLVLVNPEVSLVGSERGRASEGCLSVPEVSGEVERPLRVLLRASTLDGDRLTVECGGLLARCLQHEIDHLDGILFVDRLDAEARAAVEGDLALIERQERRLLKKNRKRA